jgi:hypothetical protein
MIGSFQFNGEIPKMALALALMMSAYNFKGIMKGP